MDDTTASAAPKTGSPPAAEPVTPAKDERTRANQGAGWCTTLEQPAAMGVIGFILSRIFRRRET